MLRKLSEKARERLFEATAMTTVLLFVAGIAMATVGGLSGNAILLGIGLGISVTITVAGLIARERNISS